MRKQFTIFLILTFILGLVPINFSNAITQNQIDAEVQIVCTDGDDSWFSGSGTIIDPKGIILTNRHVIEGAYMDTCFIGFIESISQEPNFGTEGNYNLAEVKYQTTSDDMDAAILYLDNPTNKIYSYIDIWNSNSDNLKFGDKVEVIGFPSIGGSTITYASGDFSGFGSASDGTENYIKTIVSINHGNSGGAAYNSAGSFIGMPTFVLTDINSISYILSVNSIKNWLSIILGSGYQQEVIRQKPIIEEPAISIQNDITPPAQNTFYISFAGLDNNSKEIYYGRRYGNNSTAIYEFSKIKFSWKENCSSSDCVNDNSGKIKGYYYYFGSNPNATPKISGKYTLSNELLDYRWGEEVQLSEIFEVKSGEKNYFILQAEDYSGNISNPIINFEYIYEPNKFKDIESIDIKDANNNMIGNLDYPTNEEMQVCKNTVNHCSGKVEFGYVVNTIHTNQNILYLYPNYGYDIDGIVYYISYGEDRWWHDKSRIGISTNDNYIKISDINQKGMINIFIKPYSTSMPSFFGKHIVLTINYNKNLSTKILPSDGTFISGKWSYSDASTKLKFCEIDSQLAYSLKGDILLQVESHGEAYYIYPSDNKRYYLGRPADAFSVMRQLGLGATHDFITSQTIYPDNVLGKILLDVEQNGEAYYIYPKDKKAYYLGRPADAFRIMRELGLGITNNDLNKIPEDKRRFSKTI
jgi:hypothetical protein